MRRGFRERTMTRIDESSLQELVQEDVTLRLVEPHIYSVFQHDEAANFFDKMAYFYDLVICNPLYNRLMWGYSTKAYAPLIHDALDSVKKGWVLDAGCGSLAFAAGTYVEYCKRPVIFLDYSLNLLRIAKSRLMKLNGEVPGNMVFLQADALHLPFRSECFKTIVSLNLLHVLGDLKGALHGLRAVLAEDGAMLFTTLIKNNRRADRNLEVLLKKASGVAPRDIGQLRSAFEELGMPITYNIKGNMAYIHCRRN